MVLCTGNTFTYVHSGLVSRLYPIIYVQQNIFCWRWEQKVQWCLVACEEQVLTLNCWGRALKPKSEIFKLPFASRRRFSGCNQSTMKVLFDKNVTRRNRTIGFISELENGNKTPKQYIFILHQSTCKWHNTHLQISVIDLTTMAIINCVNELVKVLPRLVLWKPPLFSLPKASTRFE